MICFRFVNIVILLISITLCDAVSYECDKNTVPCGCGQTMVGINARIINGEDAVPYSWPMMVSLTKAGLGHFCGGTILNEWYILTAAHCVDSYYSGVTSSDFMIAANIHSQSQTNKIIRQVDKIIIHPLWDKFHHIILYDIAILRLAQPLDLQKNSSIARTCLPPRSNTLEEILNYPKNGTRLVVIGWGSINYEQSSPDTLQQVTINFKHHFDKKCNAMIYNPYIHFCAGTDKDEKSDSGGPIFQWIGDRWEQAGIVSYGVSGCAMKGYSVVYTRISYFNDWIESHIQNNNNQTTASNNTTSNNTTIFQCSTYPSTSTSKCGCSYRNVILSSPTNAPSENALPYTWTMIVSIRTSTTNQHICTGTILEDFYILTAAHCLTNYKPQDLTIEAGMYYQTESEAIIRQVDQIYIHPNYSTYSDQYINDIAILRLTKSLYVDNNNYISRTCKSSIYNQWMDMNNYPPDGTRLVISGWDIIHISSSSKSKLLQQAEIYAYNSNHSNCFISGNQNQMQFCVGRNENNNDICYGNDPGSPIFEWIDGRWIQVGLASHCRSAGGSGIFTKLSSYSNWIDTLLNSTITNTSSHVYQCDRKASCGCGQTDVVLTSSHIIGGENTIKYSWPMMVSIQIRDGYDSCIGTILSDSFILTSAQCIYYYTDTNYYNITIATSIYDVSSAVKITRRVDRVYIHPDYSRTEPYLHDIAILHVSEPFLLGDESPQYLQKICVSIENEFPFNQYPKLDSQLVVVGWASSSYTAETTNTLEQISVRMIDTKYESCLNSITNDTYQFCAGLSNDHEGAKLNYLDRGDLGAPIMIYKNNHWEQVGIATVDMYEYESSLRDRAQVYTRLSPYREWMRRILNSSLPAYSPSMNISATTISNIDTTIYNSGINNYQQNHFIYQILGLLIIMCLYSSI
ncbi:unnamed protein product [Adineta steineri]|uniref:Peptidase S1 domain-containing protein n=1 Tax=Adineta steineri TaxID=433720 RepID=A0A815DA45_9BILA|nr:unnamed protein product [Adineta steineri]CAF1323943.1 unnamed protein product [Adineta steineri]